MAQNKRIWISIIISAIVLVFLIIFAFFNSRIFFLGPQITIISPKNGSSFEEPFIELKGLAKNTSFISLDGNPILIEESGYFKEKLLLSPGLSIIQIYAQDRFERSTTLTLQYAYKGTSTATDLEKIDMNVLELSNSTSSPTSTDEMVE